MQFARKVSIIVLLAGMLLTSCGGQDNAEPTPDINAIITAAVGTLAESIFQTQTALVPPATSTASSTPIQTGTPIPLPSPLPTNTVVFLNPVVVTASPLPTTTGTQYTPTVNPSTLGFGCNNLKLIQDQSIPAGTVFQPREGFTKTWKVENNGTCDWVYLYHLVFVSGNDMGGNPGNFGKVIPPGKWTQLSIGLEAPKNAGTHTGYWRFADQSGNMFGSTLTVSIVVSAPTKTPQPPAPVPPTAVPTGTPTDTPTATPTP